MKRLLAVLIMFALLVALVSCAGQDNLGTTDSSDANISASEESPEAETSEQGEETSQEETSQPAETSASEAPTAATSEPTSAANSATQNQGTQTPAQSDHTSPNNDSDKTNSQTSSTPSQSSQPASVAATGISLNKSSVTLETGDTVTLTATVSPGNATDKSVTWSTSNSGVATVSGGVVTAKSAGTATITAKTSNGKTASCTITVNAPFDIDDWVQFAIDEGVKLGLKPDPATTGCWDNPIIASSNSIYLERDIIDQLKAYKNRDNATCFWVWAKLRSDGKYDLYIGYA